jgi:hypothetical protein
MMGTGCAVHRHRSWVPMEVHHVWPLGMGGPDKIANKITLCANGHSEVHGFLDLLRKHDGKVPWLQAWRYGGKVRRLARLGYEQWREHQP